jgi:hypothetical protein
VKEKGKLGTSMQAGDTRAFKSGHEGTTAKKPSHDGCWLSMSATSESRAFGRLRPSSLLFSAVYLIARFVAFESPDIWWYLRLTTLCTSHDAIIDENHSMMVVIRMLSE